MLNVVSEFGKKNDVLFDYMLEDDTLLTPDRKAGGNKYFISHTEDDGTVVCEQYVPILVKLKEKKTVVGFNKVTNIFMKKSITSYVPQDLHDFIDYLIQNKFALNETMREWKGNFVLLKKLYFENNFIGWNINYKNYFIDVYLNRNFICVVDGVNQIININY